MLPAVGSSNEARTRTWPWSTQSGTHCENRLPTFKAGTSAAFTYGPESKTAGQEFHRQEITVGKKLYVGNLSYDVSSSDLQAMLEAHGTVQSAEVIMDRSTGQSKGFGFVEMNSDAEAQAAIAALDGQEQGGRALKVNEAKPREPRSGGGGGYGGGGGRRDRY
jgi:RNA recognition motif-containing protein